MDFSLEPGAINNFDLLLYATDMCGDYMYTHEEWLMREMEKGFELHKKCQELDPTYQMPLRYAAIKEDE